MENVLVKEQYLKDVAEAIRAKNETDNTYTPGEMAAAIGELKTDFVTEPLEVTENGIYTPGEGVDGFNKVTVDIESSGVELPPEAYVITGDCGDMFSGNKFVWYIETLGDKITTKDITDVNYMFNGCATLERIPFELNFKTTTSYYTCANAFYGCKGLKEVPKFNNCRPSDLNSIFGGCLNLREIPSDFASGFDWSWIDAQTASYYAKRSSTFYDCYSLRSFPMEFLAHHNPAVSKSNHLFYTLFSNCYVLDEIVGFPVTKPEVALKSNMFENTFKNCSRLKNLIFATQEDGTPYSANWTNQVIDLTSYVGYSAMDGNQRYIWSYNSGIPQEGKEVTNDETYQALKNDPDWWTDVPDYSRYNHDSAVATINSLPDTSVYGGTNTIKFKVSSGTSAEYTGIVGSLTDGGAINALTEEEIAVAAAKGWTVTFA